MYITALIIFLALVGMVYIKTRNPVLPAKFTISNTSPLRGLLALMIVSHHLGQRTEIPYVSDFCTGIGAVVVAIFFFISGYGLSFSFQSKGQNYLEGFLTKRLSKLLPTFLLLTASMMVFLLVYTKLTLREQIEGLLLRGWTPLPFSWFMYMIICAYIVFYFCATVGKSPKLTGILFLIVNMAIVTFLRYTLKFPSYWWFTFLSINLGYFVALYERSFQSLFQNKAQKTLIFLIVALTGSFCVMCKFYNVVLETIWYLTIAAAVYGLVSLFGMKKSRILLFASTISMELYLVHGIPLSIGQSLGLNDYFLWLFTYATAVPLAYWLNRYIAPLVSQLPLRLTFNSRF